MSHTRIEEMLTESGLPTDELAGLVDVLAPLESLAEEAPAPSPELAALFGPADQAPVPLSVRRKRALAGALVLAVSGVGATGLSAAANTLPRPIQHRVHEFSKHYLPFDLPEPPPPGQPLGADVLPPVPSAEPRPGDPGASRSAQQRAGVPTRSGRRGPAGAGGRLRGGSQRGARPQCLRPAGAHVSTLGRALECAVALGAPRRPQARGQRLDRRARRPRRPSDQDQQQGAEQGRDQGRHRGRTPPVARGRAPTPKPGGSGPRTHGRTRSDTDAARSAGAEHAGPDDHPVAGPVAGPRAGAPDRPCPQVDGG